MRCAQLSLVLACIVTIGAAEPDREAARKLLDTAVQMSGSVEPETAVVALMRAGIAYSAIDKKAALALLGRSFSSLPSVPQDDVREEYAAAIVRAAADLDVRAATELLRQVPKPAASATAVVRQLLTAKAYDEAMELLALLPAEAEYPYEAASHVIAYLPADDPRRAISFGRAVTAYGRTPAGPFPVMVERFGKQMPTELRARAVSSMLLRIEAWKDPGTSFGGTAESAGEIEMHSPQQNELRELVSVTRMFDPAAVNRILTNRPDIATALATFRKERKAAEAIEVEPQKKGEDDDGPFAPPFGIGGAPTLEGLQQGLSEYEKAEKAAQKVTEALKKDDTVEALAAAQKVPQAMRAESLAVIAAEMAKKDPARATPVLESCIAEIERVENPADRIAALVKAGDVYDKLKDPARAAAAYERALTDAASLWAQDAKAERPNLASRDTWPSVQAVRYVAHDAAEHLGAKAEELTASVTIADLNVLARIQIARALLGLPSELHNINVRWSDSK